MAAQPKPMHINLTAASGIVYDQLAKKVRGFYDAEHFTDVLNLAGQALIRVAPVYVLGPESGERLRLPDRALIGAKVMRGASVLVLADGTKLNAVSVLQSDLRAAINILRGTGIKGFSAAPRRGQRSP